MINNEEGKVGWILLWAVGIPIPILVVLFLCLGAPEATLLQKILVDAIMALETSFGLRPGRSRLNHPLQLTRSAMLLFGSSSPTEAGWASERERSIYSVRWCQES
jgi:hypothetical protein